jgi:multicomponent Na+:H+ antiporter subunit D
MAAPTTAPIDLSAAMVMAPTAIADWLVIAPMVLMISLGAVLMMVRHKLHLHGWIAIPGLVALVIIDGLLLWRVAVDGPFTMTAGRWLPPFGISFTADLLGALLAFASGLVALAAGIYGLRDINATGRRYGFYPFLMLLMAGVTGAFLTGDIFNLYVWFEVLLISSFGLLILGSERQQVDGALKYAILNLIGTTLFLIAVGYVYAIFGTLNMADIARQADAHAGTAPLMTLSTLFILAFAMKAAAFPVNFWLPASYHTPRIVVAALFGGLLTKVGVYALMRVMVMLFPLQREELSLLLAISAALTMVIGALGALAQSDLRRMAGFAVIAGIGNVMAGVAIGGILGVGGAILYALHSIVAMTALYLLVGEAARLGGSWSLQTLGGHLSPGSLGRCRRLRDLLCHGRPAAFLGAMAEDRALEGGARYRRLVALRRHPGFRLSADAGIGAHFPAGLLAAPACARGWRDACLDPCFSGSLGAFSSARRARSPAGFLRPVPGSAAAPVAGCRSQPCRSDGLYPVGFPDGRC